MDDLAQWLARPAPAWIVAAIEWLSRRWLCPVGLTRLWSFANGERQLRVIFKEPVAAVTWGHVFGRSYRMDCDKLSTL